MLSVGGSFERSVTSRSSMAAAVQGRVKLVHSSAIGGLAAALTLLTVLVAAQGRDLSGENIPVARMFLTRLYPARYAQAETQNWHRLFLNCVGINCSMKQRDDL